MKFPTIKLQTRAEKAPKGLSTLITRSTQADTESYPLGLFLSEIPLLETFGLVEGFLI